MNVFILVFSIFLTSCSVSYSDDGHGSIISFFESDKPKIHIIVSNLYSKIYIEGDDRDKVKFEQVATYSSDILVPSEISVVQGVSAKRWMSLDIGKKRYCYEGNGFPSGDNSDIGKKFILKGSQVDLQTPCFHKKFDTKYSLMAYVSYGDIVKSEMHGDVCVYYCEFTEVDFDLIAIEIEDE